MMSHGRENYVGFEVEHFAITEHTPERVVVETSSPSKHRFIDLRLTYTFTPEGVTIDRLLPLRPDATHLSQIC